MRRDCHANFGRHGRDCVGARRSGKRLCDGVLSHADASGNQHEDGAGGDPELLESAASLLYRSNRRSVDDWARHAYWRMGKLDLLVHSFRDITDDIGGGIESGRPASGLRRRVRRVLAYDLGNGTERLEQLGRPDSTDGNSAHVGGGIAEFGWPPGGGGPWKAGRRRLSPLPDSGEQRLGLLVELWGAPRYSGISHNAGDSFTGWPAECVCRRNRYDTGLMHHADSSRDRLGELDRSLASHDTF